MRTARAWNRQKVHWTFDEAAQVAEHLKRDLGIDRCLFTIGGWTEGGYDCRHPDNLPANAECGGDGALAGGDRADPGPRLRRLPARQLSGHVQRCQSWDPGAIQKHADGSLMAGGRWLGGRAYLVCAPKQVELASRPQNLACHQEAVRTPQRLHRHDLRRRAAAVRRSEAPARPKRRHRLEDQAERRWPARRSASSAASAVASGPCPTATSSRGWSASPGGPITT